MRYTLRLVSGRWLVLPDDPAEWAAHCQRLETLRDFAASPAALIEYCRIRAERTGP